MKIRAIAAAAAALVILAACGGSEPSAGSTRTKNAALETIPCAKGGLCKLGDTGPNGGIVVDIRITDKLTGQAELTEAATTNFNFPDAVGGLCTGTPPDDWSAGKRPATGLEDSTLLANKCETSPAMSLAEAAVQGSYIPSIDELLKVAKALKLAQQPLPKVKCYWSSTSAPAEYGKPVVRAIYNTESGDYVEGTRDLSSWCALRTVSLSKGRAEIGTTMTIPVATSNVVNDASTTTQYATTIQNQNTTTTASVAPGSCAAGDACKVGDTGPGGGIVFYAATTSQPWGQYLEVSKSLDPRFDTMWCDVPPATDLPNSDAIGNGKAISEEYAKPCTKGALRLAVDYVANGLDDWYLPTFGEAMELYKVRDIAKIDVQWTYTSTAKALNKQVVAVYMGDGNVASVNPLEGHAVRAIRAFGPKQITCANGGACKVGDIGPGGGIVFRADPKPQEWGQYMEISAKTLDPAFNTMWCDNTPTIPTPADVRAGAAKANIGPARWLTETLAKSCTKGALKLAADYVSNGFDDWLLPPVDQLKVLYDNRATVKIEPNWLLSLTSASTNSGLRVNAMYMGDSKTQLVALNAGFGVRAMRVFGPTDANANSTTTTTVAKPLTCAAGGACKVGDIGPGGGIVFYAESSKQAWGQYLEAPTKDIAIDQFWCDNRVTDIAGAAGIAIGSGKSNTVDMDAACKSGAGQAAADFVYGGKDDWYLPSKDELNVMFARRKMLTMSGYYFSSSEATSFSAWDQYFGDGTQYPQGKNNGRIVRPIRAF